MEVHFSHVLKIAGMFVSRESIKKPIASECLTLPMPFPYYENSFFHVFSIVWISVSRKICMKPIP